jgi:hypothetical protein
MKEDHIVPDQLEADAVVPQCLDNQYVSDRVFNYMIRNGASYKDREVGRMRKAEIQTEFIRSLIYSSQVIINRVWMANNGYLYDNYLPPNRESRQAFCELMRTKAVVPYLMNEPSLVSVHETKSDRPTEGMSALEQLTKEAEYVQCVRLAADVNENRRHTSKLAKRFWEGLNRLYGLEPNERNAMASELFSDPDYLHKGDGWTTFNDALNNLSEYARHNLQITRNTVYKDHFGREGCTDADIEMGRFRSPDRNHPFVLELKKLVDLIYNTNLPDRLRRYTFTPVTLPTRTALQDEPGAGQDISKIEPILTNGDTLEFIRRTFMANVGEGMTLPLLSELTVADVVELRRLDQWVKFKDSQQEILKNPLDCLNIFPRFQSHFDAFQRAMSKWYTHRYQKPRTHEQYVSFVTFALSVAGKLIVAGMGGDHPVAKLAVGFVPDLIPNRVKGFAAKVMVSVYDLDERRLDKERSYSLELMETAEELTRADVADLVSRISKNGEGVDTDTGPRAADQGKKPITDGTSARVAGRL